MNDLDVLLSKAVIASVEHQLDHQRYTRLVEQLKQSRITPEEFFTRFDLRLPGFEEDLKEIEDRVLKNFLEIEDKKSEKWIVIKNKFLIEPILRTFADSDKKIILDYTAMNSETIPKILDLCQLPNTSGYRKMKQLIDDGFVVPTGMVTSFEGRRALLYKSIIQRIQIFVRKNEITAKILVPKEVLSTSRLVKAISDLKSDASAN